MVVGKNIPHDSGRGHVTGESIYIDDRPFARNELLVGIVGSSVAHGRLCAVDFQAARAIPGVVGVYTHRDLGGHNQLGPIVADDVLLAEDLCTYIGQPIAVIAADTRAALQQAQAAVQLTIDTLPAIFTIPEAIAAQQFLGQPLQIACGDVDRALAEAEQTLSGVFECGGQEHFYLESQAAIAYPGEHRTLTIHASTQHPTEVQREAAAVLGLQQHQIVCVTQRMGGAFGGKESQASAFAIMAALVALKTQRPARCTLDVDTDMQITGKRHAFRNEYRVAFTREGLITGLQVDLYANGGASTDLSPAILQRAMFHIDNAYYLPNARITGRVCRTNLPSNTAFRGFGGPQGVATIENIIEEIAITLRKDAHEIRERNCYGTSDRHRTPYGAIVTNNHLPAILQQLTRSAEYPARRRTIDAHHRQSRTTLKGLAMTAVKFGISFTSKFLNQGSALVHLYLDGSVQVSTGGTEMGQGLNTKIQQLVAEEFAIDPARVRVMPTSTEKNNNASATAASAGTDLNGGAAVAACRQLKARLGEAACRHFQGEATDQPALTPTDIQFVDGHVVVARDPSRRLPWAALLHQAYHERVSLGERGFYATPQIGYDWATRTGSPFLYFTTGWAAAEVTIDRFTGALRIDRVDLLMDIGQSINPGIDRGQLTGGFIQGVGWCTTEELTYDAEGHLLTHSPTTYKIPNVQDVPPIFNVAWIDNPDNVMNVRGSKAVGEPPLLLGIAVWAAIKNALSYVCPGQIPPLRLPATHEEICRCITDMLQLPAGN